MSDRYITEDELNDILNQYFKKEEVQEKFATKADLEYDKSGFCEMPRHMEEVSTRAAEDIKLLTEINKKLNRAGDTTTGDFNIVGNSSISGNLTVTGSITGTASASSKLTHTLTIKSADGTALLTWDGSSDAELTLNY